MELQIEYTNPMLPEPIKIDFLVYDTALENKQLDSHDFTYYGYASLEELKESGDNETYKQIFQEVPYAIDVMSGGRLDVLVRTSERLMQRLGKVQLTNQQNRTVLECLYDKLKELDEDDYESLEKFQSTDEVLDFLGE